MIQYCMNELVYTAPEPQGSYVTADLTAEFVSPSGVKQTVKGFYDGNNTYKIRFCPEETGIYTYGISGIIEDSGSIHVEQADNNCNRHGIVRACDTHFKHADGTWFYPFGTTIYALIHQERELVKKTMETLSRAPFNKVRMCLFPKDYDYNKNEPELYAYNKDAEGRWDYNCPCYEFFRYLEECIEELDAMGIQCDLILFHPYDRWGFADMSDTEIDLYLDYVTRRLSAYPNVWWSLANEFDIMKYDIKVWEHIAEYVSGNDPYGHLLSNHNCITFWDFDNAHTSHICLQIKSVDDINHMTERYNKPVMVDECCYEGNLLYEWGNISGYEMMSRFWKCITLGGYCTHGETFLSDDDILWWSKGGILKGESPARIAFLRSIVEQIGGPLTYCGNEFTRKRYDALRADPAAYENDFWRAVANAPWERAKEAMNNDKEFMCHYGDNAYLRFYARKCPGAGVFDLPEEKKYRIEVIDTWNMAREVAAEDVNGHVSVSLPGREAMALLAVAI